MLNNKLDNSPRCLIINLFDVHLGLEKKYTGIDKQSTIKTNEQSRESNAGEGTI